jgi:hypothetical protein
MFRSLAVSTLILGSALAFVQPQVAAARDRDDFRYARDRRAFIRHEQREEWREHERWERRFDRNRYRRGFYDRWGYWHWY